jgi:hypothetical protein
MGRMMETSRTTPRDLGVGGARVVWAVLAAAAWLGGGCDSSGTGDPGPDAGVPRAITPDDLVAAAGCAAPTGAGTDHTQTIRADETSTAADGPHRVPFPLTIEATVTIEPCATVRLGPGVTLDVGNPPTAGAIRARGAVDVGADGAVRARPVTFARLDPAMPWAQLRVNRSGTLELSVAQLTGGGQVGASEPGALRVDGPAGGTNDGPVYRSTTVDRVLVEGSASFGVNLTGWGAFTESSDVLWIRGSGGDAAPYALALEPGVASTLPRGLALTGNRRDAILMRTSKAFTRDDTLRALGAPYVQQGTLYLSSSADGATTTLTIEPGVTLAFDGASSGIAVGASAERLGVLVARGTAAAPITFTSARDAKAAGDWIGLVFRAFPRLGSRIEHARIEYAGGPSGTNGFGCGPEGQGNDAAIIIQGQGPEGREGPDEVFVTDTRFTNIGGATVIVSGWYGDGPNLAANNVFGEGVPACHVSQPRTNFDGGDFCEGRRGVCW